MSMLLSGSRNSAGAGRRIAPRESATFLSGLSDFFPLLDASAMISPLGETASAAVMMTLPYFALARQPERACSFAPVCGGTWGQGFESVLELATRATGWAEAREIDPHNEILEQVWHEAIGLAWSAELTARCHLMPAPYLAWESGMLLAAIAIGEQLRLLDSGSERAEARLGQATIRQIENLVIQYDFAPHMSLVSTVRKCSYVGPWSALSLGYRLAQRQARLEWAEGVLDPIECLPSTRVMERCVVDQLRAQWSSYMDIARRAWLTGLATARRQRAASV